jgi:hypothetical protein
MTEKHMRYRSVVILSLLALAAGACERSPQSSGETAPTRMPVGAVQVPVQKPPVTTALPLMVVTKNAMCGCCNTWVERMRAAGFRVEVRDVDNLDPIKTRVGVPAGKGT